jgi:hypothetical protein
MTYFTTPIIDKTTISGFLVPIFITTGNYYLRKYPFSSNTYTGTYSNGVWDFGYVDDDEYQLWNATSQVTSWGTRYIGDKNPTFENQIISGLLTLSGGLLQDSLVCSGQAMFLSSVAFDKSGGAGNDLARINQVQCDKIVNYLGNGITVDGVLLKDNLVTSNIAGLSSNNTFSGTNTFSTTVNLSTGLSADGRATFTQGIDVWGGGLTSNFYHPVRFNMYIPKCSLQATNGYDLTNLNSVVTYVDAKVGSIVSSLSAYNQDYQILRLHPNGIQEIGKVYTTWATVMAAAMAKNPTSANQICVLIEGSGTGTTIDICPQSSSTTAFADYVHFVGLTPNITVNVQPISTTSFEASVKSAIKIENLNFVGWGDDTFNFKKIYLKNCSTESTTDSYGQYYMFSYTTCEFGDGNILKGVHAHTLTDCTGERILCSLKPTVSIINEAYPIQYYTANELSIGNKILKDNGTTFEFNTSLSATSFKTGSTTYGDGGVTGSGFNVNCVLQTGQFLLGDNNLEDTGTAVGFSKGIDTYGNVNLLSATSINLSATNISLTGGLILNQVPVDGKIRLTLGNGNVYAITVEEV